MNAIFSKTILIFVILVTIVPNSTFAQSKPHALNVITSIPPFYFITQEIMGTTGSPVLLLSQLASPHHVTLKPSQIQQLHQADLLIWGDPNLETFMPKHLNTLPKTTQILTLSKTDGLTLWPMKSKANKHRHTHTEHGHFDPHFWLSPSNAQHLAQNIAKQLSVLDPKHSAIYETNLKHFIQRLQKVDRNIQNQLKPIKQQHFLVLHNSYQYFEKHYGLIPAQIIAMNPEIPSGAKHLKKIHALVNQIHPACVLAEPYYPKSKRDLIPIRQVSSDPLGFDLITQQATYTDLLESVARSFIHCLTPL